MVFHKPLILNLNIFAFPGSFTHANMLINVNKTFLFSLVTILHGSMDIHGSIPGVDNPGPAAVVKLSPMKALHESNRTPKGRCMIGNFTTAGGLVIDYNSDRS